MRGARAILERVSPRVRDRAVAWSLIVVVLLAVVGPRLYFLYKPYTFLIGDCPYYAATAISILRDHDLDLRNQLDGGPEAHAWYVSQGPRGEWYSKHPILMPLLTVPLLPLFGTNAFLIENVLVLLALAVVLYELARTAVPSTAAVGGALATVLGSFLIRYDYNYSANLFASLLLSLAVLALLRDRSGAAGLLSGLACFAYTPNFVALPLLLVYAGWRGKGRGASVFAAAAAPALLAQGLLNLHMFGSMLVSPYMRIMSLHDGQIVLHSHTGDFSNPMWEGIRGQLTDPVHGLVRTAPVLLMAVPGYGLWLRKQRNHALLCLSLGGLLFLVFSRYIWWATSNVGNRFLMPLVALSAPAVACAVEWLIERSRGLRRQPQATPSCSTGESSPAGARPSGLKSRTGSG